MIEAILDSGITFILFLQGLGEWIFAPMKAITFLGKEDFYLFILPIIYWSLDASLGLRIGLVLIMSNSLTAILKWAFHMPRPFWYDERVRGVVAETSFGVPSDHSQTPLAVLGLIAATLKRTWVWVAALSLVFLIGFSRMVLGVHFYLDVLVGWTFGALVIWVFLRLEAPVKAWLDRQSFRRQIGTAFAVSMGVLLVGALVWAVSSDFAVPQQWVDNAVADQPEVSITTPFDFNSLITPAAVLFGLAVGALWLAREGGYNAGGDWAKRGLRILVGVVGVLLLKEGLGAVFPRGANLLGYTLRYLRYSLVGLWIIGIAPWLFMRMGLAERPG